MSDEADPAVLCAERQLKLLAETAKFDWSHAVIEMRPRLE
jgi:hypothetical protein